MRPNLLSIYKDPPEGTKLRHQLPLSDLTAVARQKDPKRKAKHVFGLFSPARNFHIEAPSEEEAQEWVELIRREARIDEEEEEMILMSPTKSRQEQPDVPENATNIQQSGHREHVLSSSSDAEATPAPLNRLKGCNPYDAQAATTTPSALHSATRRPSQGLHVHSGNEAGSISDFSDTAFFRDSSLSLPKPSTEATAVPISPPSAADPIYHPTTITNTSTSTTASASTSRRRPKRTTSNLSASAQSPFEDSDRVIYHGYLHLLKSNIRRWAHLWAVLRPKSLSFYKSEEEYKALYLIPFDQIVDAVDIDPISKGKQHCFMVITEERNWRFAAGDEAGLEKWLGAIKSVVARRKEGEIRGRVGSVTEGKKENHKGEQTLLRAEGKTAVVEPAGEDGGPVKPERVPAQPHAVPIR